MATDGTADPIDETGGNAERAPMGGSFLANQVAFGSQLRLNERLRFRSCADNCSRRNEDQVVCEAVTSAMAEAPQRRAASKRACWSSDPGNIWRVRFYPIGIRGALFCGTVTTERKTLPRREQVFRPQSILIVPAFPASSAGWMAVGFGLGLAGGGSGSCFSNWNSS